MVAIGLYLRSISLGVSWSKCFLRRRRSSSGSGPWPPVDAYWIFVLGQLPAVYRSGTSATSGGFGGGR